ncbi:MAG: NUDIX hydrolase [Acidobacteria bacterium]|nr:NUDIX hydrolase [Acidobacteriota bacterium]
MQFQEKGGHFRYCPMCGHTLASRQLKAGDPERLVCSTCAFVLYLDPKVAVGTIIALADRRIVLVRRAIEPGYGQWVFPGGYVDRGEIVSEAAHREAREEAGIDIRLDGLVSIYSYSGRPPVIIVYAATATGGDLRHDEESLEIGAFSEAEIPWGDLAFQSTHEALRDYYAGVLHAHCR